MKKNKSLKSSKKFCGGSGFEEYYSNIFQNRWSNLKKALFAPQVYTEWNAGGGKTYFLDPASVFAALQLPLENAKNILDLCAAPGGKTLVIASRMDEDAVLTSNERSFSRKQRLVNVCSSCLPEKIKNRINIIQSNGSQLCLKQNSCFDRILLDAPCSSERHVLNSEKHLKEWSAARIKSLAFEQWALISSAYRLLKPDGILLYSTCALCPEENSKIIERLLKKFSDAENISDYRYCSFNEDISKFCKIDFQICAEKTENGFHILPDLQNGAGPIWFSLIKKNTFV